MSEAIYHHDAYVRGFEARVLEAGPEGVLLDRTAFYPGGGGQPHDTGALRWEGGGARVTALKRGPGGPIHVLEGEARPPAGALVQGEIDWERRHALMRAHTALHVLCGVIWRDYGAPVTGAQMEVGSARMDFELDRMSADFASEIEAKVNAEIAAARPVVARVLPREEAFRIPDLIRTKINLLPPGIQAVRVVGHESKGRINKRLRIAIEEPPRPATPPERPVAS